MVAFGSQPFGTRRAISRGSSFAQSTRQSPAYSALATPASAGAATQPSGVKPSLEDYVRSQPDLPNSSLLKQMQTRVRAEDMIGLPGALNPPPQVQSFYRTLLGNRLRAIDSLASASRTSGLNALEARGLGTSSEVGRLYSDISGREQLAGQEAAAGVQALQYAQFQSALDFERQKYLTRLAADVGQDRSPWWQKALPILGEAAGTIAAFSGGGGAPGPEPVAGYGGYQ